MDRSQALKRIQGEFKQALERLWPGLKVTFESGGH